MPFDVTDSGAGGTTNAVCAPPSYAKTARLLAWNLLEDAAAAFPTRASGRLNPSSTLAGYRGRDVANADLGKPWYAKGGFVVSSVTTEGYEDAPNYNLRVTNGATVNLDCRNPAATTTYWQDGPTMAAYIQVQGRASLLTGASSFTVEFDDERTATHFNSSTVPTFKFRISMSTNFTIVTLAASDANTIAPSIGFSQAADKSGASTYTSDTVACHTEDDCIFYFQGRGSIQFGDRGGSSVWTDRYRWLILFGLNVSANASVKVYLGASVAALDIVADSTFTADRTMFTLGSASSMVVWEGTDGGLVINASADVGADHWPCTIHVVDLLAWRAANNSGADALGPNHDYMRIKISDPTNVQGHPGFAYACIRDRKSVV